MAEPIPVNPDVLRWARESIGKTPDDVAAQLKKDVSVIFAWESGKLSPTYVQLEKLAYEIYKRPLALFFFPDPPDEDPISKSFRTLPETVLESLSPRVRHLVRKAKVLQLNLSELFEGKNPSGRFILSDLSYSSSISVVTLAKDVREYLQIDISTQKEWNNINTALDNWRSIFESVGIFIFKDSFNTPGKKTKTSIECPISGFCLYDKIFPVIYLNNNKAKARQIFTLFHELAHLLMKTGGIETRNDDFINQLQGRDKSIEILCNKLAGELLVPADDFQMRTHDLEITEKEISKLASEYCVSREVVLRRFLDYGSIDSSFYESMVDKWSQAPRRSKSSGGNTIATKGAYLGEQYIKRVFSSYYKGDISLDKVSEFLDINTDSIQKWEEWLWKRSSIIQ